MMDLSNLMADVSGSVMTLRHPATDEVISDDKGKPMTITLVGTDSDQYRKEVKRRFSELQRNKGRKAQSVDLDDAEQKAVELLTCCTVDCHIVFDGKAVALADIGKIYAEPKLRWLREHAEAFVADRANFINSSKAS